ncbi:MAG: hypothetical protein KME17_31640 [Cyanosarcina radialis HA8281-LM2]|jgi:hypothetical protein|nr:hypothetical protein [Cyanosarcina radialis HA8281-LM2]
MQAPLAVTENLWLKMAVTFILSGLKAISIGLEVLAKSGKPYGVRLLAKEKVSVFSSFEESLLINEKVLVK